MAVRFHSIGGWGAITTGKNLGAIIGDLNDLRAFTTPEMFASVKLDLQDRKGAPQQTDVVQLDAQVVDHAEENGQYIVSVRFHGLTPTSMKLEGLDKHLRLIDSYKKLHAARARAIARRFNLVHPVVTEFITQIQRLFVLLCEIFQPIGALLRQSAANMLLIIEFREMQNFGRWGAARGQS